MVEKIETPARLKQLLSPFLSTFSKTKPENTKTIANKVDSNSPDNSEKDASLADARNRKQFYCRVETFSPLTWFAKPLDLSPLVCARFGWQNVDTDMLQCVRCKAFLCGQLPKAVDTQVYRDSCNKLERNLKESHEQLCKWSTNPSPESFLHVPYHDKDELSNNFWSRVVSLQCARIPSMSYKSIEEKSVTEETFQGYVEGIRDSDREKRDVSKEVGVCALCGWLYSESQLDILQCNSCRRKIGLWDYTHKSINDCSEQLHSTKEHHTSQDTVNIGDEGSNKDKVDVDNAIQQSIIDSEDSKSQAVGDGKDTGCVNGDLTKGNEDSITEHVNGNTHQGDKDKNDSCEEPRRKRPRLEKQCFDPIAEHRYWCPWLKPTSLYLHPRSTRSQGTSPLKSPPCPPGLLQSSPMGNTCEQIYPAWLLVAKVLSHSSDADEDFSRQMKERAQIEGKRHLRRVLQQCTSPTSPPTLPETPPKQSKP